MLHITAEVHINVNINIRLTNKIQLYFDNTKENFSMLMKMNLSQRKEISFYPHLIDVVSHCTFLS